MIELVDTTVKTPQYNASMAYFHKIIDYYSHRGSGRYYHYDDDRDYKFKMPSCMQMKWCIENLDSRDLILTGGVHFPLSSVNRMIPKVPSLSCQPTTSPPVRCHVALLSFEPKKLDFDPTIWYNSKAQ